MDPGGGTVIVESSIPATTIQELERRGHRIRRGVDDFGGYQGILIDWKNGALQGATEPRKDGAAVGY
jgi:gamma-glutamyltranspeptidase/glutathione hydrolase